MVEGVGFEPTVGLTLRSISSRVPSTGLSHPSNFFFNRSSAAKCRVAVVLWCSKQEVSKQTPNVSHLCFDGGTLRGKF